MQVVACACAIEETLGDGARAAAHRVDPAISIVVDVTHASDVPGGIAGTTGVQIPGRGPTITRGLGLNRKLTDRDRAGRRRCRHHAAARGPRRRLLDLHRRGRRTARARGERARPRLDPAAPHALPRGGLLALGSRRGRRADRALLPLADGGRGLAVTSEHAIAGCPSRELSGRRKENSQKENPQKRRPASRVQVVTTGHIPTVDQRREHRRPPINRNAGARQAGTPNDRY